MAQSLRDRDGGAGYRTATGNAGGNCVACGGCVDGGGVRDAGEDIDALAAAVLTALSRQEQRARGLDGFMHDATVEINVEGEGYNGLGDVSR